MRLEPVNGVSYVTGRQQLVGVSAEIAQARKALRVAAGPDRWEAALAEVHRMRTEGSVTLIEALYRVYDNLAAGWTPAVAR